MSTRIPCWKLRSSLLGSSLLGSLSLLGVESLSWSGVFFDLTVDGDGCLLFLIIGLEGSYSEWSESKAVGGMAGRASSWATGGFWASWGTCGGGEGSGNGGSSPVNVRKAFLKEDLHIIQSFLPLRSQCLQLNKKPVVILYPLWLRWWPPSPSVQKVGSQSLVLVINCNGGKNVNDQQC